MQIEFICYIAESLGTAQAGLNMFSEHRDGKNPKSFGRLGYRNLLALGYSCLYFVFHLEVALFTSRKMLTEFPIEYYV